MKSLLLALLLTAPLSAQATVPRRLQAALLPSRYDSVNVVVQQTDEVRALFRGPDTAAVRRHIEQRLAAVGITVVTDSTAKRSARIPLLLVQVDVLKNGRNWYCSVTAAVYLGSAYQGDSAMIGWSPQGEGKDEQMLEETPTTRDMDGVVDAALEKLVKQLWPTQ